MNFERTNTKISLLEDFYTHFNEDTRLKTRHGMVEYITNMKYIHEVLENYNNPKILDLGAGCGAYSVPLFEEGYDITSVELVKKNCDVIKEKNNNIRVFNSDARDLKCLGDELFDVILIFGPIYHVHGKDEKELVIKEALNHLKENGTILISYYMNSYGVMMYGFIKNNIKESITNNQIDDNFNIITTDTDLFSFDTLELINSYNSDLKLDRVKIISSEGLSDYFRTPLNKLSDEEFGLYIKYHLSVCEKNEYLGYASHLLDIVKKSSF